MRTFQIKRGDRRPKLRATLTDSAGAAIDLTGNLGVRMHLRRAGSEVVSIDATVDVVDEPNGVVEYAWQDGDTDVAGRFEAEFEIGWIDGPETVPNGGNEPFVVVNINEDIK